MRNRTAYGASRRDFIKIGAASAAGIMVVPPYMPGSGDFVTPNNELATAHFGTHSCDLGTKPAADPVKRLPKAGDLLTPAWESRWNGKRVVSIGDSIMAAPNGFLMRTVSALGMELIGNYAIGGSTIAERADQPTARTPIITRYEEMHDEADLVIVAAGTNDCNYGWTPFGGCSDRTKNTFFGALHLLCRGLLIKYIGKQILFMTPIKRNQQLVTPETLNDAGKTQKDYAGAIKEVCAYWGIPVLDMYSECSINPYIAEHVDAFIPDKTHPNAAGHELMAKRLIGYLQQL